MSTRKTVLLLVVVLFAVPAWSKVFVRWTQPVPPPVKRLGVHELAIPWNAAALSSFRGAARQGYRAYAEVAIGEASSAAKTDRKSTRLNSSHDQISYAVFCLKKKKK